MFGKLNSAEDGYDLNLILVPDDTTLKHYGISRILTELQFWLKIIVQVFDAIVGDDGIRLCHIFILLATFLLVAYVMSYFVYFLTLVILW